MPCAVVYAAVCCVYLISAAKVYERSKFIEAGIEHHDMYFTDGG